MTAAEAYRLRDRLAKGLIARMKAGELTLAEVQARLAADAPLPVSYEDAESVADGFEEQG